LAASNARYALSYIASSSEFDGATSFAAMVPKTSNETAANFRIFMLGENRTIAG